MRLITNTQISVDGVYQGSGGRPDPTWANTSVLSGDVAAAIGELKAGPGGELQVHGSGALVRWLLTLRVYRPAGRPRYASDPST